MDIIKDRSGEQKLIEGRDRTAEADTLFVLDKSDLSGSVDTSETTWTFVR